MRKYASVVVILSVAISLAGKKKPPKVPDPVLCSIKTVFVEGNNASASYIRGRWQTWQGIVVVNSVEEADAILEVNQDSTQEVTTWPARSLWTRYVTSVILKDKIGKQLWTDTSSTMEAWPIQQKASDSAGFVMTHFKREAACGAK